MPAGLQRHAAVEGPQADLAAQVLQGGGFRCGVAAGGGAEDGGGGGGCGAGEGRAGWEGGRQGRQGGTKGEEEGRVSRWTQNGSGGKDVGEVKSRRQIWQLLPFHPAPPPSWALHTLCCPSPLAFMVNSPTHLVTLSPPGEYTPGALPPPAPAQLLAPPSSSLTPAPPPSGAEGSPLRNSKNCSTSGATLFTRLMRSPSCSGAVGGREGEDRARWGREVLLV